MMNFHLNRRQMRNLRSELTNRALNDPAYFYYEGNALGFDQRLDVINREKIQFISAHITAIGQQVQQADTTFMIVTLVLIVLIMPLVFMLCTDWYKRKAHNFYDIPYSTYQKLEALIMNEKINDITLWVCDSNFNQDKARCIYDMLRKSKVQQFTFINGVIDIDYGTGKYSTFTEYMKPIKALPIQTSLSWWNTTVE